jgi:RND family efflux transporter MFP subunit
MSDAKRSGWRNPKLWQAAGGIAALLLIIFYLAGGFHRKVGPGVAQDTIGIPVPAGARILEVREEIVRTPVGVVGTVGSEERVNLSSRVNADVARVAVTAGDRVVRGQLLAELDARDLRQQLEAAEADLARADAEFRRTEELYRNEAATRRQLELDEAALRAATARVEEIRVLLSHTRIVAPIDGVVVDRLVEAGDLATVGTVLLTIYDPGRMRLEAPVPLRLAGRLHPGDELEVELESPDRTVTGLVQEIVAAVDAQSRTRLVKVLLPEDPGPVLPGMFGRLLVPGDPRPAILIPRDAVYRVGQLTLVQVAGQDRAVRRDVRLGAARGDRWEVLAGLAAGERILLHPVHEEE